MTRTKDSSRLLTIIIYLFLNAPGQISWTLKEDVFNYFLSYKFWVSLLILSFIILEVLEYSLWHYRYKSRLIPRLFLLVRVGLLGAACLFKDTVPYNILFLPYFSLIFFYAYHSFSLRVSLALFTGAVAFILADMILMLFGRGWLPYIEKGPAVVLVYKLPVLFICYFFAHIWSRERSINDDNRELVRSLNARELELKRLLAEVGKTAALEERTRLARDIHDSVGHALMVVQIQLNKASAYAEVDMKETKAAIEEARKTANEATGDIRASLDILNSQEQILAMDEAVHKLCSPLRQNGTLVSSQIRGEETGYNHMVLMGIYRMVQEGITNILRYAEASEVKIEIRFGERYADVLLRDNGIGFDPALLPEAGRYGLAGLRRRLEMVGGHLEVNSAPGEGCELKVRLMKDPVQLAGEYDGKD